MGCEWEGSPYLKGSTSISSNQKFDDGEFRGQPHCGKLLGINISTPRHIGHYVEGTCSSSSDEEGGREAGQHSSGRVTSCLLFPPLESDGLPLFTRKLRATACLQLQVDKDLSSEGELEHDSPLSFTGTSRAALLQNPDVIAANASPAPIYIGNRVVLV